jgi:NitT/TauT family transport system substrate-binding protein
MNSDHQNREITSDTIRSSAEKPVRTVRLLTYWYPTAQFAGYQVGLHKGIFRKHGIQLEIIQYDQHLDIEQLLRKGETDMIVSWLVNALKIRDNGINIINIAQFSSRSSLMLVAKKSSGIKTLQDLNGRRAGIWQGYELQPMALFNKFNLKVDIVPIGSTNNLFLRDGVDVTNANYFDEYHTILNSGYDSTELVTFPFYNYGFNFLEDGLYCIEDFAKENPELCRDFVAATTESWDFAFSHPEEALKIVIEQTRKMNFPVNFSHQQWILKTYQKLYITGNSTSINTTMSQKDYLHVAGIMLENQQIKYIVPFDTFYTSAFHPSLNP